MAIKHFWIKFNHGVEIGAALAYEGHAKRTGSSKIYSILRDELYHKSGLEHILAELGERPNNAIDLAFTVVGKTIRFLCKFSPLWSLDFVARSMEMFAIMNYNRLAQKYPQYKDSFEHMAKAEMDHEEYFRLGPEKYENLQFLRESLVGGRFGQRTVGMHPSLGWGYQSGPSPWKSWEELYKDISKYDN